MLYCCPPLVLAADRVTDALGVVELRDLPDRQPRHPLRLKGATPLLERLWRIALADIESNVVTTENGTYFGAGTAFGVRIYTRDISYSGVFGLNRLYPDILLQSLKVTRLMRQKLGFMVSRDHVADAIPVDWQRTELGELEFLKKYHTNSYMRRTDDVVWLWCVEDLFTANPSIAEWQWAYDMGHYCFDRFYQPFHDPADGLFRGQATFVDIHHGLDHKGTGYPEEWSTQDCVLIKATSTNCLYVKGLEVMARISEEVGKRDEAAQWRERAQSLRQAIRVHLRRPDGTFAYYKDREGRLAERRDALGTAFGVLMGVVTGEEAVAACRDYPVTDAGVPLFLPFFPTARTYHNNTAWPFVDTFFIKALEQSDGQARTAQNAALLARTCRGGTFHEWVDFRTKAVRGSGGQLWTAAAFVDTCRRAGWVAL